MARVGLVVSHKPERLEIEVKKTMTIRGNRAVAAATAALKAPGLVARAKPITVRAPPLKEVDDGRLADSLRDMYVRGELTDVALICGGHTFLAHRVMLAAHSAVFRSGLANMSSSAECVPGARPEIRFADVENPDAVKIMLDQMYKVDIATWEGRDPRLQQELTLDLWRLATHFQLPALRSLVARWLTRDVNSGNVLERLARCDELEFPEVHERITNALAQNKEALADLATNKDLAENPQLMQVLLQHHSDPQPKKKRARRS